MLFKLTFITAGLATIVAAIPSPRAIPASSCFTSLLCCNTVERASDPPIPTLLALLGIVLQDQNVLVGLTCTPISPLDSNPCPAGIIVCCDDNNFAATPSLGGIPPSSCSTGLYCCNTVVKSSDPYAAQLLGLLGIVLQNGDVDVGITCSPLSLIEFNSCPSGIIVCCEDGSHGGLVAIGFLQDQNVLIGIGCSPISVIGVGAPAVPVSSPAARILTGAPWFLCVFQPRFRYRCWARNRSSSLTFTS
ncbi:hypothetical protein D9757_005965 [Collybiopsis confluens]|uniref:Hydrophobin n=1 Tax=Collybiopsis confluens TaxID=2823264 RepID=A0A8H5HUI9_9AGAR|nr:hypothetical protein D9757_005965 [Collybiopsis confluens]